MVLQLTNTETEKKILEEIQQQVSKFSIKSKSVSDMGTEITLEIKIKDDNTEFMNKLQDSDGVNRITMIAYDQDLSSV